MLGYPTRLKDEVRILSLSAAHCACLTGRLDNWIDSDFLMLRDLNIAVSRIVLIYGLYGGSWHAVIDDRLMEA